MNKMTTASNNPLFLTTSRMTSLDIAELMDKRHDHVIRDIRKLIDEGAITAPKFGCSEYIDASGKANPMYNLDFEATMVLITGYDAKRRALVIDRWMQLERGDALPAAALEQAAISTVEEIREAAAMEVLAVVAEAAGKGYPANFIPELVQCRMAGFSCEQTGRVLNVSSTAVSNWHRKVDGTGLRLPKGRNCSSTVAFFRNGGNHNQLSLPFGEA